MAHFRVVWRRQRKRLSLPELNQYPETPAAYYEGQYPGSRAVYANRVEFRWKLQQLPELNRYPAAIAAPYPSYVPSGYLKRAETRRKYIEALVAHVFPATPAAYYEGQYPGSALAEGFRTKFDQTRQTVEHDVYPVTPPTVAVLPAVISTGFHRREALRRTSLFTPVTIFEVPDITFGIASMLTSIGTGISSGITDSGKGVLSSMDGTQGISSKINSKGAGITSPINSDGPGVESEL